MLPNVDIRETGVLEHDAGATQHTARTPLVTGNTSCSQSLLSAAHLTWGEKIGRATPVEAYIITFVA